jgi:hypothetical protein
VQRDKHELDELDVCMARGKVIFQRGGGFGRGGGGIAAAVFKY